MGKLLIVENEEELNFIYKEFLSQLDYQVVTASNLEMARQILSSEKIDLLLLDNILGRERGIEFLPWLRNHLPNLKVLMITGDLNIEELPEQKYVEHILYKPFEMTELIKLIDSCIGG